MQPPSSSSKRLGISAYAPNQLPNCVPYEATSPEFRDFFYNRILPETDQKKSLLFWECFQHLGELHTVAIRGGENTPQSQVFHAALQSITCLDFSLVEFNYKQINIFEQLCKFVTQHYQGHAICFPAIKHDIFVEMNYETYVWNCATAITALIQHNRHLSLVSLNGCTIFSSVKQTGVKQLIEAIKDNNTIKQLSLANCDLDFGLINFLVKSLKENPVPIALNLKGNDISGHDGLFESRLFNDLQQHPAFLTSFDYDWKADYRSHYCMSLKINDCIEHNRKNLTLLLQFQLGDMPRDITQFIAYLIYLLNKPG